MQCEECDAGGEHPEWNAEDYSECNQAMSCGKGQGLVGHSGTDGGRCEPCEVGYFSDNLEAAACEEGDTTCPAHAHDETDCKCDADYYPTTVLRWDRVITGTWTGTCSAEYAEVADLPQGYAGQMDCGAPGSSEIGRAHV